ncbi:MAG: hypothetical protein JWQ18_2368 [Conexibacter sp.]|nr:hypothetical protein [Conexibacter sp.]
MIHTPASDRAATVGGDSELRALIDATDWVDTHEHLVEEKTRLLDGGYAFEDWRGGVTRVPRDWTCVLGGYALNDMRSAGLSREQLAVLTAEDGDPEAAWHTLAPHLDRIRDTGFGWAIDASTEALTGLRLASETVCEIDARLRALRQPGYYATVLREHAGISRAQVNSLDQDPFCETATPDLLEQDLSIVPLVLGAHARLEAASNREISRLDDYLELMEDCFARWAPSAVAVKCPWAYARPLAVAIDDDPPHRAFSRLRAGTASADDRRAVEDFLLLRALDLAAGHERPVKFHLGYLADLALPAYSHLDRHVGDIGRLVHARPQNTFVLMHMAWPDQERLLALARHSPNVIVDLCWAWSLAPRSAVDFTQRFLLSAPSTKLLGFGADVVCVETVPGHAALARHGLALALEGLIADGWLTSQRALALVPRLMHGNADRILPSPVARSTTASGSP